MSWEGSQKTLVGGAGRRVRAGTLDVRLAPGQVNPEEPSTTWGWAPAGHGQQGLRSLPVPAQPLRTGPCPQEPAAPTLLGTVLPGLAGLLHTEEGILETRGLAEAQRQAQGGLLP